MLYEKILENFPKTVSNNKKYPDIIWTTFCLERYHNKNELTNHSGIIVTLNKEDAISFGEKDSYKSSLDVYSYRLLHVENISLLEYLKSANINDKNKLIEDITYIMTDEFINKFDGLHFIEDELIYLKNPRARMVTNSFKMTH